MDGNARLDAAVLDADRAHDAATSAGRRLEARGAPSEELARALAELDEHRAYAGDAQALEAAAARVRAVIESAMRPAPAAARTDQSDSTPGAIPSPVLQAAPCDTHEAAELPVVEPLEYALAYAALGWPVLPVGTDKKPLGGKGIRYATADEATIRRWWARWPDAGIGIHLEAAGLCAIDIDPRNGATQTPGDFPATLTARTGGGGWHLIYRVPEGLTLPGKLGAGLDIKHRGYIIVEPSAHPSGGRYMWSDFNPIDAALVGLPEIQLFPVHLLEEPAGVLPARPNDANDLEELVNEQTLDELRSALASMASDDRDLWVRLGQALKRLGNPGRALWVEWSQTSAKFDQDDVDRVWESLSGDRTGYAAVFAEAQRGGWENPKSAERKYDALADFQELPPGGGANHPGEDSSPSTHGGSAAPPVGNRFEGQRLASFAAGKPAPQIVQGWLPQAELAVIVGETGSGKSFFAFDMAAAIARGAPWREVNKTKARRVAYVIAEGVGGARGRATAYTNHHGIALDDLDIIAFPHSPNLMLKNDANELIAAIQKHAPVGIVIVDTLASVTPGSNESASEDMGRALAHLKAIHRATGALVVVAHHLGKDLSKGARGHSSLKAAADAEITITRNGSLRTATVTKMKDGADGTVMQFRLLVVPVGTDEDGNAVDSCVVEHAHVEEAPSAREPGGKNTKTVWKAINNLAGLGGAETSVAAVIEETVKGIVVDPNAKRDRRRELATQALQTLAELGWVTVDNGRVLIRGRK